MSRRRRGFNSNVRLSVWNKHNGNCAYCGTPISLTEMEIDHINPYKDSKDNSIINLNPSCSCCNRLKAARTIEEFRVIIRTISSNVIKNEDLLMRYNIINASVKNWDGKFYFEM